MKNTPCLDCASRELGCHSRCAEYIRWTAELAKKRGLIWDGKHDQAKAYECEKAGRLK